MGAQGLTGAPYPGGLVTVNNVADFGPGVLQPAVGVFGHYRTPVSPPYADVLPRADGRRRTRVYPEYGQPMIRRLSCRLEGRRFGAGLWHRVMQCPGLPPCQPAVRLARRRAAGGRGRGSVPGGLRSHGRDQRSVRLLLQHRPQPGDGLRGDLPEQPRQRCAAAPRWYLSAIGTSQYSTSNGCPTAPVSSSPSCTYYWTRSAPTARSTSMTLPRTASVRCLLPGPSASATSASRPTASPLSSTRRPTSTVTRRAACGS